MDITQKLDFSKIKMGFEDLFSEPTRFCATFAAIAKVAIT